MLLPESQTVQALLTTLLAFEGEALNNPALQAELTQEMMGKLTNMPQFMGMGVAGLTILFDISCLAKTGRRFHQLPPEARQKKVQRWKQARLGLFRDTVEVYEKMGTFIFYSLQEGG